MKAYLVKNSVTIILKPKGADIRDFERNLFYKEEYTGDFELNYFIYDDHISAHILPLDPYEKYKKYIDDKIWLNKTVYTFICDKHKDLSNITRKIYLTLLRSSYKDNNMVWATYMSDINSTDMVVYE